MSCSSCAGTIVFVTVLLLITKKQQRLSWVLTHYQVQTLCPDCMCIGYDVITLCLASCHEAHVRS